MNLDLILVSFEIVIRDQDLEIRDPDQVGLRDRSWSSIVKDGDTNVDIIAFNLELRLETKFDMLNI